MLCFKNKISFIFKNLKHLFNLFLKKKIKIPHNQSISNIVTQKKKSIYNIIKLIITKMSMHFNTNKYLTTQLTAVVSALHEYSVPYNIAPLHIT
jgi:hypothetical protein